MARNTHTDTPWTQTGIRGASSGSLSALGPLEADSALLSMLSAPFSSCYAIVTKRYRDTFLKSKETDWLIDWLLAWLLDCLFDWLIDWLTDEFGLIRFTVFDWNWIGFEYNLFLLIHFSLQVDFGGSNQVVNFDPGLLDKAQRVSPSKGQLGISIRQRCGSPAEVLHMETYAEVPSATGWS